MPMSPIRLFKTNRLVRRLKGLGFASGRKGKRLRVDRATVLALVEKRCRVSLKSFGRWLAVTAKRLPSDPFTDLGREAVPATTRPVVATPVPSSG